jgi:hypothetical protein
MWRSGSPTSLTFFPFAIPVAAVNPLTILLTCSLDSFTMRAFIFICVLLCLVLNASAVDYYVGPKGSLSSSGLSLAAPFLTIQQCSNKAQAGDRCLIRGGIYRESVILQADSVSYIAYNSEKVVISGAEPVSPSAWQVSSHPTFAGLKYKVYEASITLSQDVRGNGVTRSNNVFIDGIMAPIARWPNINLHDKPYGTSQLNFTEEYSTISPSSCPSVKLTYNTDVTHPAATVPDGALSHSYRGGQPPANIYKGVKVNMCVGSMYYTKTCLVSQNSGCGISFDCSGRDGQAADAFGAATFGNFIPRDQNQYYLWNSLVLLDTPGESTPLSLHLILVTCSVSSFQRVSNKILLWCYC